MDLLLLSVHQWSSLVSQFLVICSCLSYKILIEEIEKIITTTTAITTKIDLLGNSFSENDEIVSRIKIPPIIVEFIIKYL